MVIAAADVNPLMTGTGMKSTRNPKMNRVKVNGLLHSNNKVLTPCYIGDQ